MVDPAEAEREQRGMAAGSALELTSHAYLALDFDASPDIEEYDLGYALDVKSYLQAIRRAASEIEKQVDAYVAEKLKPATYYRHRNDIVKVGGSGAWKVKEEKVNNGLLAAYIGAEWPQVVNLKANGAITVTRIEGLAKKYAAQYDDDFDPESVAQMARNEFFEYKQNESAISLMPADKAPKYAQALVEGESFIPKPKKPKAIEA